VAGVFSLHGIDKGFTGLKGPGLSIRATTLVEGILAVNS